MPAQPLSASGHRSGRGAALPALAAAATLLASILVMVGASTTVAAANPPSRQQEIVVHVNCVAEGGFGTVYLGLEHISTNLGSPGGDLTLWAPGADPEHDLPLLSGYNRAITRDGMTLRGEIPLRAWGGEDIVGWASYEVALAYAGPSEFDRVKGPLVEYDVRYNQQLRNEKERIPLRASGVVTLPGIGSVPLTDCGGEEVDQDIFITSPATRVGAARYPFGFDDGDFCEAKASGSTALLSLTGGEAAIVILRDGEEEAMAFGFVFPDMAQTTMTGSVPMYGPDGTLLGQAALRSTLRVVDRDSAKYRIGDSFGIVHVEVVAADGTISFDGVTYSFADCEGRRVRERTIERRVGGTG